MPVQSKFSSNQSISFHFYPGFFFIPRHKADQYTVILGAADTTHHYFWLCFELRVNYKSFTYRDLGEPTPKKPRHVYRTREQRAMEGTEGSGSNDAESNHSGEPGLPDPGRSPEDNSTDKWGALST